MSGCTDECWATLRGARAHCSACHATFGGITAFDRHHKRQTREGRHGGCKEPSISGLEQTSEGVWVQPAPKTSESPTPSRSRGVLA